VGIGCGRGAVWVTVSMDRRVQLCRDGQWNGSL
jgi:hypothetical protein